MQKKISVLDFLISNYHYATYIICIYGMMVEKPYFKQKKI